MTRKAKKKFKHEWDAKVRKLHFLALIHKLKLTKRLRQ